MHFPELIPALIGGLAAVFFFGSVIWGIFDILGDERLDGLQRMLWLVAVFAVPFLGIAAWLYVRSGAPDAKRRAPGVVRLPPKL